MCNPDPEAPRWGGAEIGVGVQHSKVSDLGFRVKRTGKVCSGGGEEPANLARLSESRKGLAVRRMGEKPKRREPSISPRKRHHLVQTAMPV